MDDSYYSLIRHTDDGHYVGWVPDLPGVTASGVSEAEIVYRLSRDARELLDRILARGLPMPRPSAAADLPLGDHRGPYRRFLLELG
jgi:predicted RNase H-like HicB family nuclease